MTERKKAKPKPKTEPTAKLTERAVKILAKGTFREMARRKLGIGPGLWSVWIRDGKLERQQRDEGLIEELGPRGRFVEAIEKAEEEAHAKILDQGVLSPEAGPEAKRWFLKVRYPELYSGQSARGIMDDDAGELVKVDPRDALKEKLRALLEGMGAEE